MDRARGEPLVSLEAIETGSTLGCVTPKDMELQLAVGEHVLDRTDLRGSRHRQAYSLAQCADQSRPGWLTAHQRVTGEIPQTSK